MSKGGRPNGMGGRGGPLMPGGGGPLMPGGGGPRIPGGGGPRMPCGGPGPPRNLGGGGPLCPNGGGPGGLEPTNSCRLLMNNYKTIEKNCILKTFKININLFDC